MSKYDNYFDVNKATWNKKVAVHTKSAMYDMPSFIKGKSSLNEYELRALGEVSGMSMLHLQCHFGQDTLSWSRMGVKCTGVDISDEGIAYARQLNEQLGLDAKFVCCNVLDVAHHINDVFDIVFTSYGTIGWLPDLKPWAKMIAHMLKKGGEFYMVEFHPIAWMFDYSADVPKMVHGYHQKEVIYEEYEGTYADTSSKIISKEYGWNHGLGEVVSALSQAGLNITYLNEYDESPYNVFPNLQKTTSGMYKMNDQLYPLIFEIKATK